MSIPSRETAKKTSVAELLAFYGDGDKYPSVVQWCALLASEHQGKLVVVNLIKLADTIVSGPFVSRGSFISSRCL